MQVPATKYRVFISYSHADRPQVGRMADIFEELGLAPMWDSGNRPGLPFDAQIKRYIAHAHLFVPFITASSDERKWVQQEIGFAVALNVPVMPVTLGADPGEMLAGIHAIQLRHGVEELRSRLTWTRVDSFLQERQRASAALYECAEYHGHRTTMMATYCNDVRQLGYDGLVRQRGGLSSLHIPNKHINHRTWKLRYGGKRDDPDNNGRLLEERLALEFHARAAGCTGRRSRRCR